MSGEQRVRVRALLLFAALAAASPAYAAATSPPSPPYPVPREFDVGGRHPRDPRSYGGGGGVGQASGYGVSRTPPIGAWGEREGLDEGLHAVQAEMEGGGVGEGEKEGDMTDRMGASSVSSSRRRGLSSSKERLQEYVERGWGGAPQQPRKAGNNRWGEVGPQRGDTAGGEAWGKALKSAGKSIRNLSKHVYQRSEDYWREPKRRRAIVYFAAVAAMTLVLAYGEHCTRVRSAEGHQLREREEFMKEIEREMVLEGESIKKSLAEARALKTAQDITAKELAEEEESIRIRRDNLRKRAAALQEEQLLLSVRKAKTQLASQPDWDDVAGGESREAVLNRLREIREEANRQYWLDDKARKEAGEALTAMALLETQVRQRYNTLLRVMGLDRLSPSVRQQALRLKELLKNSVAEFEIQVHAAIGAFSDDLWVIKAERKLLKDPAMKEALRRGIKQEWKAQEQYQQQTAQMQSAGREALDANRRKINMVMTALDSPMSEGHRQQLQGLLFGLLSNELYQESVLQVLDADVSRHLEEREWIQKMEGLLDEAERKANIARETWATRRAALAELKGRMKAIRGILSSLDDKMDLCFAVHKTWSEKWGRIEGSQ